MLSPRGAAGGGWSWESTVCPDPARSIGRPGSRHDGRTQGFHRPSRGFRSKRPGFRAEGRSGRTVCFETRPSGPIIPGPGGGRVPDAHLDRILRPVKLPAPGGRSGRRDQGCFSRSAVRPARIEGRRVRDPGRRSTAVLEAREQAVPRLPGDPDAAGRLRPANGNRRIRWRTRRPGEPEPARRSVPTSPRAPIDGLQMRRGAASSCPEPPGYSQRAWLQGCQT